MADWNLQKEIAEKIGDMCLSNSDILSVMEGTASARQVNSSLCKLVTHGLVERMEKGCYQLTKKGFEALVSDNFYAEHNTAPRPCYKARPRNARDRIWQAMRILQKFTMADLAIRAETTCNNVSKYLRPLEKAGYISFLRKAGDDKATSNGVNVYLLMRNTGEKRPLYKARFNWVIDQNTGEKREIK